MDIICLSRQSKLLLLQDLLVCKFSIRTVRAKNAFTKGKKQLTKAFSLCLNKRTTKTGIWSTSLYGSLRCRQLYGAESWTLNKEDVRRLESCGMWLWRKVLNISWSDKVRNEEVLRRDGEERAIISVINRRQRDWLGYTLLHGDLVPLLIGGRIIGKRPP